MTTGDLAFKAAQRLYNLAYVLALITALVAVGGAALGAALLAKADTSGAKGGAAAILAGSVIAGLFSILPYVAAQALARYIQFRVDLEMDVTT